MTDELTEGNPDQFVNSYSVFISSCINPAFSSVYDIYNIYFIFVEANLIIESFNPPSHKASADAKVS